MDRQQPRSTSDEIDLYIRTYYSLLRSTGVVAVRAFEEAHAFSASSLHEGARDPAPDVAAFAYSAARLPSCMPFVRLIVMGQSNEQFAAAGHDVRTWERVTARGRRRPMRYRDGVLAAFVTSTTDIDDLVPMVTCYQIEWNKLHGCLSRGLGEHDEATLRGAFGASFERDLQLVRERPVDLSVQLLNGTFVDYQRAAQRWWSGIEPAYLAGGKRRPVYFVSSNTHSLANLLGGYAREHGERITTFARARDPEGLADDLDAARAGGDDGLLANLQYYLLHKLVRDTGALEEVQRFDAESGIATLESPGHIDVAAQLIELGKLRPERLDPRVRVAGVERVRDSDAVIINIDYPLGMAAYHHLSRVAQGIDELRGVYVMGKAATLNGRVGDVMLSSMAYDEHSMNSYLFKNCMTAADVAPYVSEATVLDNQKALTVRGSFLQNRDYMGVFYREGYTVLEMEAGPYLSAIYELVRPQRHPKDEIVHLSTELPFDFGLLHYASDTPYSRRQSLLSKSLSYFGVDSTYGCAIAIARRILSLESQR